MRIRLLLSHRRHATTMFILPVPILLMLHVALKIIHFTALILTAPALTNPMFASTFILALGSGLFLEHARFLLMTALVNPPAMQIVVVLPGVTIIMTTMRYRSTRWQVTQVSGTLR